MPISELTAFTASDLTDNLLGSMYCVSPRFATRTRRTALRRRADPLAEELGKYAIRHTPTVRVRTGSGAIIPCGFVMSTGVQRCPSCKSAITCVYGAFWLNANARNRAGIP